MRELLSELTIRDLRDALIVMALATVLCFVAAAVIVGSTDVGLVLSTVWEWQVNAPIVRLFRALQGTA